MKLRNLFLYNYTPGENFSIKSAEDADLFAPQKNHGGPELSGNFRKDLKTLKEEFSFGKSGDIKMREFTIRISEKEHDAVIFFIDGLVNKQLINDFILSPLMIKSREIEVSSFRSIGDILLSQSEYKETNILGELTFDLNFGSVIMLVDGAKTAFSLDVKGWQHRGVESPQTERIIRGPNDAFSEQLRENTALIRHLIRNKSLMCQEFKVGTISQTPVSVMYIQNVANASLVEETLRRIKNIDVDYIFSAAEMEQLIEDKTVTTLPQFISTERPDRASRALLDGRVVVLVDGSPFVLILPTTFFELNESAEDNYLRYPYVNMIRTIRWIAFFLSLLLPGLYVAVVSFHSELLPTGILMSIISSREPVPFPSILEIIIMEISLEIIREASVRVPEASGSTLSIVGALILGQAAVSAGIVSPILIIIVSITAIGSFATPNYYLGLSARILRFGYIFLGAAAGFLGIISGLFINVLLWTNTKSMGLPMGAPFAPVTKKGSPTALFVPPIWKREHRDDYINPKRKIKQSHISRKWKG
ncbi:MAG: spore germination protein [Clostridia bacterium]|nr:spore germination protein [Clostridia bacterium]